MCLRQLRGLTQRYYQGMSSDMVILSHTLTIHGSSLKAMGQLLMTLTVP